MNLQEVLSVIDRYIDEANQDALVASSKYDDNGAAQLRTAAAHLQMLRRELTWPLAREALMTKLKSEGVPIDPLMGPSS